MQGSATKAPSERAITLVLATAWVGYVSADIPGSHIIIGERLNVALGFLLSAVTIICAIRGHVLLTAMRIGQQIERDTIPGQRGPHQLV